MVDELLPCPFCGEVPWSGPYRNGWAVQCVNTKCTVKPSISRRTWGTLIADWNTRTPSGLDTEMRKRVAESLCVTMAAAQSVGPHVGSDQWFDALARAALNTIRTGDAKG